jgi:hypothetical protein
MEQRNAHRWFLSLQDGEEELVPMANSTETREAPPPTGLETVPVITIDELMPDGNEAYHARSTEPFFDSGTRSRMAKRDPRDAKTKSKAKGGKGDVSDPYAEEGDNALPASDDAAYAALFERGTETGPRGKTITAKQREKARRRDKKRRARMDLKMPLKFVIETLESRVEETELTRELIVYIPFLVMFIFLYMTGADTEQAYWARAQLGGQLATGQLPTLESYGWPLNPLQVEDYHISFMLPQVRNAQDWHMWFQSQVLDFWWDLDDENASQLANSFVQGSNLKFGAMRVRTLRMRDNSCELNAELTAWNYSKGDGVGGGTLREMRKCWAKYEDGKLNRSSIGPASDPHFMPFIDCSRASKQDLFGYVDRYPCLGNMIEFPTMLSRFEVKAIAEKLRGKAGYNLGTLSDADLADGYGEDDLLFHPFATRAVIVEVFSYLPFIDQFQAYKVLTEITPGGRFVHFMQVNTFRIWSLDSGIDYFNTIYFFIFYLFVFYYVAKFINGAARSFAQSRFVEFLINFWNFWDFVNLSCFMAVFVCRIAWIRSSSALHDSQLLATTSYDDRLDFIALLFNLQLWLNAVNTIISFLKILKFIELNPTLNIVTRSLAAAQQSLIGVLIIFVIVILSYGITGVAIFSNGVEDFRDLATAMSTLMRMLIGDFNYIALRDENRFAAPLFFWSFMILGLFLILNFIIGIILEAFEDESERTRAEPIPILIARFFKRISASWRTFYADPKLYMQRRRERRAHHFARTGRTRSQTVIDLLKQYRIVEIADDFSLAELEGLTDAEIEAVLKDEEINRHDLLRIFTVADPENADEFVAWMTEDYLDMLWELCVRNYHVHRLGDERAEAFALRMALEDAAEDALAFVTGIGIGRGADTSRKAEAQDPAPRSKAAYMAAEESAPAVNRSAGDTIARKGAEEARRREQLAAVQQLFRVPEATKERIRTMDEVLRQAQDEAVEIVRALLREKPSVMSSDAQLGAPSLSAADAVRTIRRRSLDSDNSRTDFSSARGQ